MHKIQVQCKYIKHGSLYIIYIMYRVPTRPYPLFCSTFVPRSSDRFNGPGGCLVPGQLDRIIGSNWKWTNGGQMMSHGFKVIGIWWDMCCQSLSHLEIKRNTWVVKWSSLFFEPMLSSTERKVTWECQHHWFLVCWVPYCFLTPDGFGLDLESL